MRRIRLALSPRSRQVSLLAPKLRKPRPAHRSPPPLSQLKAEKTSASSSELSVCLKRQPKQTAALMAAIAYSLISKWL